MRTAAVRKGLTLVEVILSLVVLAIIVVAVYRSYTFFLNSIAFYLKRADAHMEIDYAFENIRMHALSASEIDGDSMFEAGVTGSRYSFNFTGEANHSNITPDDDSDNAHYSYYIKDSALVLEKKQGAVRNEETVISGHLKPTVAFTYTKNTEPSFLTVTIEAGPRDGRINKTEGMKLWFVDVIQ
ncbi:MAG: prepilin-type N-terminal cleavage/methylation domain-containing protein [Candidatus Omnitrophica bacterium]|nr:prepilin-type N-terminal cleavage/methylation domain-containing protein [Candidatus Omnitrophota bacterium]